MDMQALQQDKYLLPFRQLLDADLLHVVLLVKVVELDVPRQLQCTAMLSTAGTRSVGYP